MCLVKALFCANAALHTLHTCGFSPVWVRLCVVNWLFSANAARHPSKLHLNGLSPVWVRMCAVKWLFCVNPLPHTLHINCLLPEILVGPELTDNCPLAIAAACCGIVPAGFEGEDADVDDVAEGL